MIMCTVTGCSREDQKNGVPPFVTQNFKTAQWTLF